MPYPHRIRLRGPWHYERLANAGEPQAIGKSGKADTRPTSGKTSLPADWSEYLGDAFRGRVCYRRYFHRPTGLSEDDRVWLVIEGVDAHGSVALNDQTLGVVESYALFAEFDVTSRLSTRNELVLTVALEADEPSSSSRPRPGRESEPGGPIGEVVLEIRSSVELRDLAVGAICDSSGMPQLHLAGVAVGRATTGSLDLVVTCAGHEVLYREVEVDAPFCETRAVADLPCWSPTTEPRGPAALATVEIKLLDGGRAAWQADRRIAATAVRWNASTRELFVADRSVGRPISIIDAAIRSHEPRASQTPFHASLLPFAGQEVGCSAIWPEGVYRACDELGVAVIQAMPPIWAAGVCQRLAHHPSIVAWSAPRTGLTSWPDERTAPAIRWRPWVPWEWVTG